jgi:hypothetical protein
MVTKKEKAAEKYADKQLDNDNNWSADVKAFLAGDKSGYARGWKECEAWFKERGIAVFKERDKQGGHPEDVTPHLQQFGVWKTTKGYQVEKKGLAASPQRNRQGGKR